jgi:hypothetical protein
MNPLSLFGMWFLVPIASGWNLLEGGAEEVTCSCVGKRKALKRESVPSWKK